MAVEIWNHWTDVTDRTVDFQHLFYYECPTAQVISRSIHNCSSWFGGEYCVNFFNLYYQIKLWIIRLRSIGPQDKKPVVLLIKQPKSYWQTYKNGRAMIDWLRLRTYEARAPSPNYLFNWLIFFKLISSTTQQIKQHNVVCFLHCPFDCSDDPKSCNKCRERVDNITRSGNIETSTTRNERIR